MQTSPLADTSLKPTIVLYDDACPLCTAEIDHYRKLVKYHPVEWVGINKSIQFVNELGYSREDVLKKLHVVKPNGEVAIGAHAFVTIWHSLKFYHYLSIIVRKLRLVPILDFFYQYFAAYTYKKRIANDK